MHNLLIQKKKVRVEDFSDYKALLEKAVQEHRHVKGYQTLLANAAGCHPSFISQVLKSAIHLTPDHGAGIAHFWNLDDEETRYFLTLIQLGRAATPALKQVLKSTLDEMRERHFSLANRLEQPTLEKKQSAYYSSWIYSAIHVLLSIPEYQTKEKIGGKLQVSQELLERVFQELEEMGLIEKDSGEKWKTTNKSIHLPSHSPLLGSHLQNWRSKALVSATEGGGEKVHYSAVHALSQKDSETLRQMVLTFIEESRAVVKPSPEEKAVCINLDFFPL